MPVYSWNDVVVAADARRCSRVTLEGDRLAAFDRGQPLRAPATEKQIHASAGIIHKMPPFTERKVISAAEVGYVSDVEVAVAIIGEYPGSRYVHCPVTSDGRSIEKVCRVTSAARIRVGGKEVQTA